MLSLDTRKLVPSLPGSITVKQLSGNDHSTLWSLLDLDIESTSTVTDPDAPRVAVGVSLRLCKKGMVEAIALATEKFVALLAIESNTAKLGPGPSDGDNNDLSGVLNHPRLVLLGVGMTRILLLLHHQLKIRANGVDLPALFKRPTERAAPSPGDIVLAELDKGARKYDINALWYGSQSNDDLCLRAWLSACMAAKGLLAIPENARVSTRDLLSSHLACLSQHVMNAELLEAKQSNHLDNDFERCEIAKGPGGQKLVIHNSRFQTRVRHSMQTYVEVNGGEIKARTLHAKGKQTTLRFKGKHHDLQSDAIQKIRVVGRGEATSAQAARDTFIMQLLQGEAVLDRSEFVRLLWFPSGKIQKNVPLAQHYFPDLNPSQRSVANAMILGEDPFITVHGPPGTGKTTTIAAALSQWQTLEQPVWVIAQSNVGVQNIAEHILNLGIDFKLIVSMDFFFEWHEDLYQGDMQKTLIRSNEFSADDFDVVCRIGDSRIILCTLAMLSNPLLDRCGAFRYRPMEILVVDEASQIDTLEFMHLFDKFDELQKVCMFGDPKQLPPYGKEYAKQMRTIFDFPHLMGASYFLDTQRRMPVQLGNFLSEVMYDSRLKSWHEDSSTACIRAIDVRKGTEEAVHSSWKNTEEAHTVVNLVRNYYANLGRDALRIITPYDAQRNLITQLLKNANLPSDIVFNVDSFQGHQAPYIIVSAVRTTQPGFLSSTNRMNVMLSRCKRGMVLVTQRAFIDNGGKRTLLGKLVRRWQILEGADGVWVDAMAVAGGRAHLPGAPGKPQAAQLAINAEALTASVAALSLTLAAGARAISG